MGTIWITVYFPLKVDCSTDIFHWNIQILKVAALFCHQIFARTAHPWFYEWSTKTFLLYISETLPVPFLVFFDPSESLLWCPIPRAVRPTFTATNQKHSTWKSLIPLFSFNLDILAILFPMIFIATLSVSEIFDMSFLPTLGCNMACKRWLHYITSS